MDTNKNTYTVIYSVLLVVIVAALLAFAAEALKPMQQRNVEIETKQMILKSVNLVPQIETAPDKGKYVEDIYSKHITDSTIKGTSGDQSIYICKLDSGEKVYIMKVSGVGLWGPIWGYVAIKNDFNTIYGSTFDHKSETPGLGAEINTNWFSSQFNDKKLFENEEFVSVQIVKGGADKSNPHQVDAISGGTITSKALEASIKNSLTNYVPFLKQMLEKTKSYQITDTLQIVSDSLVNPVDSLSKPVK